MGGYGSGRRWRYDSRSTVNDFHSIDVRRWAREGYLTEGRSFGWNWLRNGEIVGSIRATATAHTIILSYRHRSQNEGWISKRYPVALERTPCHFGGSRVWFNCPAKGCGKRVAMLYGGEVFACRQCHSLAFPSQNEDPSDRAARRADKIRARLGWEEGILNGEGLKPKGMHWRTFERLYQQQAEYSEQSVARIIAKFGMMLPDEFDLRDGS